MGGVAGDLDLADSGGWSKIQPSERGSVRAINSPGSASAGGQLRAVKLDGFAPDSNVEVVVGDPAVYRPEREVADWRGKEPIGRLEALKLLDAGDIEAIKAGVEAEITAACAFAEESPYADVAEAYTDVFVN